MNLHLESNNASQIEYQIVFKYRWIFNQNIVKINSNGLKKSGKVNGLKRKIPPLNRSSALHAELYTEQEVKRALDFLE